MHIENFVKKVLQEDIGRGCLFERAFEDLGQANFHQNGLGEKAQIIAKSSGMLAGVPYVQKLAKIGNIELVCHFKDGQVFQPKDVLFELSGQAVTLLKFERSFLNILCHLSGIATNVQKFVQKCAPYGVKILDTRKTAPLLRIEEKYATRCGGAFNHRFGLDDCLMIKDTHLKAVGLEHLETFLQTARKNMPITSTIELEVENLRQFEKVLHLPLDIVMLDNFCTIDIEKAVKIRDAHQSRLKLETSGNVTLENIESYAKTGVDAISSGAMIYEAKWVDLSMK